MNDFLLAALLGVVEGVTEFLPVSSTAHLRLTEALLHVRLDDPYWKMFTVVIQAGAMLSLPIYFRDRIVRLLATFPRGAQGDRTALTHPLGLIAAAFVTTVIPVFLLTKVIGKNLESLVVMGLSLVIGGAIMWAIDARNAPAEAAGPGAIGRVRTWRMDDMSLGQAIWIGVCQIFSAVFPGTSRSMSTITGGQIAGVSRAAALEFSFFLSMPIMAAATGYDLLKSLRGSAANPLGASSIDAHGALVLAVGLLVSFVIAYGSVAWLMAFVRTHGFAPFALYRLVLGAFVLAFAAHLF